MSETIEHPVELRGAVRDLWTVYCDEVLVVGRAGTGKTRGLLERAIYIGEKFPGSRQLFLRQTLKSLRQSVLVTLEEEVLWPGHAAYGKSTATRDTRSSYRWIDEEGGAEIVLGGMDTPEKFFSAQFDIIWFFEAREFSFDAYQTLARANRNGKVPFQQRILDTNPAQQHHWINRHFPIGHVKVPDDHPCHRIRPMEDEDQSIRLLSRPEDNPAFFDEGGQMTARGWAYQRKLDSMRGARRRNLRDGDWASEEGMVLEEWDETIHMVHLKDVPPIKWYFAGFDSGMRHPACLQVWGVDDDDRMFRVVEVYRCGMGIDWWANVVAELDDEFRLKAVVCDHDPEYVKKFNDFLNDKGRPRIAKNAIKAIIPGLHMVSWALSEADDGPRMFFVRDALRYGRCPIRDESMKPACFEEEVGDYVWQKGVDGKPMKEAPDPLCADHACDTARYAAMFKWKKDLSVTGENPEFAEGTLGALFGHEELLGRGRKLRKRYGG